MSDSPGKSCRGMALRLLLGCDLTEVRPAFLAVRGFLAERGLSAQELTTCELALARHKSCRLRSRLCAARRKLSSGSTIILPVSSGRPGQSCLIPTASGGG